MSIIENFLTTQEEEDIIEAIRSAEQKTSGEIRIHIERTSPKEAMDRALDVFFQLKMNNTKLQNGVLIYLAVEDKSFVIFGDKGINDVVKDNFWDSTRDVMQAHFKNGNFKQGLIEGILKAGEQLQQYFPWQKGDVNELPDDISKS
ncbi:TPM domain-containing protein [Flavobacteriaceae bacterium LMO-SS05]